MGVLLIYYLTHSKPMETRAVHELPFFWKNKYKQTKKN